jgi:nucleoside-diphosphate-sugar epimerase
VYGPHQCFDAYGNVSPIVADRILKGVSMTIFGDDEQTRDFVNVADVAAANLAAAFTPGVSGDFNIGSGETYISCVPSARAIDIATALIGERPIKPKVTGVRPGEKIHEILVSEEECHRAVDRGDYYAILPMLPELLSDVTVYAGLNDEYSSAGGVMTGDALVDVLHRHKLMIDDVLPASGEIVR